MAAWLPSSTGSRATGIAAAVTSVSGPAPNASNRSAAPNSPFCSANASAVISLLSFWSIASPLATSFFAAGIVLSLPASK